VAVTAVVTLAGPVRAGLLAAGVALVVALVRWLRWESRFDDRAPAVALRAEVVARPVDLLGERHAMGTDAHRAYAHALHAVTGAYLAELDREAQR
jgi:hypothetical protein